jgi:hypothetical protein
MGGTHHVLSYMRVTLGSNKIILARRDTGVAELRFLFVSDEALKTLGDDKHDSYREAPQSTVTARQYRAH